MSLKPDQTSSASQSGAARDLTTDSIPRHLIAFSTPMLAGSLLQTAYSVINAFWVGKFLGTSALAAVTVSMPVVFVIVAVAGGITMATNILIAQRVGARDWGGVKRVVQTSVALIGTLSLLALAQGHHLLAQQASGGGGGNRFS